MATYRRLPNLPSEMRNNAAKMVTGAWKSWVAGGSVGRPPHFAKPLVQYTYGRDWSVSDQCVVSLRMLRHRVHLAYVSSPQGAERLSSAVASSRIGGALLLERRRGWFLNVSVELPSPPSWKPVTPIGVDRGVDYVAVARALGKRPLVCSARTVRHSKNSIRPNQEPSASQRHGLRKTRAAPAQRSREPTRCGYQQEGRKGGRRLRN